MSSVTGFLKKLFAAISNNHLQSYAQSLAYGAVFALLPSIVLLVLLLGFFNAVDVVFRATTELKPYLPDDVFSLLHDRLNAAARSDAKTQLGVGVLVSVLVALWGASSAVRSAMGALNVVHKCNDSRSWVIRTLISLVLAVGTIILVAAALVIIVTGGAVSDAVFSVIGLSAEAAGAWAVLRWPILVVLLWLGVALLYRYGSGRRDPLRFVTLGTFVATFGWVSFSVAFSFYLKISGGLSAAWGAVAGVILLLLYVQYAALIVLIGAQIDALREEHRALQTNA